MELGAGVVKAAFPFFRCHNEPEPTRLWKIARDRHTGPTAVSKDSALPTDDKRPNHSKILDVKLAGNSERKRTASAFSSLSWHHCWKVPTQKARERRAPKCDHRWDLFYIPIQGWVDSYAPMRVMKIWVCHAWDPIQAVVVWKSQ